MNKQELTQAIEKAKRQLSLAKEQDEKDFAQKKVARLEKELSELEKPKEEPKKKEEAKPKAEPKPEAKAQPKTASKPKRDDDDDLDCDDLEEREETAKKYGYDLDELLAKARESKAKSAKRAKERANEPKKTPATRNKEAVSKTTERVTTNVEGRAKKGNVEPREIEKLIAEYEMAISKLKKILAGLKGDKKMARGGGVEARKNPKIVRSFFEEEEIEYRRGGEVSNGVQKRLEELRQAIRDENISYGELAELQSLVKHIDKGDVELLEAAGVDEQDLAQYGMPIAICNRTGSFVYPTEVEGYYGYCPELDEDLYKMETTPLMARGDGVGSPTNKEVFDNGEVTDSWASDIGGSNESEDFVIIYRGQSYLVSIDNETQEVIRPRAVASVYEMRRGGRAASRTTTPRTTGSDPKRDKMYHALPSGKRQSNRISEIEKKDGTSFMRRNANQYVDAKHSGNREYYESAKNRSDKGKWY